MSTQHPPISREKKIDIIFDYLFNNQKALEEEFFWNALTQEEIKKISSLKKEDVISFDDLKSKIHENA